MRLTSITITDLAAFAGTVAFQLPAVSLIQGDHGKGKSSLQEIMAYAFGRRPLADAGARGIEHDPSIIHGDKPKGEAVILFDDGMSYRVLVTPTETTRQIKVAGGKRWDRATPQLIDSLVNALSYDPLALKTLTEKQRVEALLMASPVTVTMEEITAAIGALNGTYRTQPPSLETINALVDHIRELRRVENVAADTQRKHAQELESALPPETEQPDDVGALRAKKESMDKSEQKCIDTARKVFTEHQAEENKSHQSRVDVFKSDFDAKVEALRRELNLNIQHSVGQANDSIEDARTLANQAVTDKRAELAPERERLTAEIATAEERASVHARAEGTRAAFKKAMTEAKTRAATATAMTEAITRLTDLKNAVASRLAIKGITIAAPKAGQPVDICREENGALIPFSRWNESDKEAFCLRMAVLLHGQCGVVFVDEIGHLTPERRERLIASCKKHAENGMQWILGEATEGELKVIGV